MLRKTSKLLVVLAAVLMVSSMVAFKPVHAEEIDTGTVNTIENVEDTTVDTGTTGADTNEGETNTPVATPDTEIKVDNPLNSSDAELNGLVEKIKGKTTELVGAMQAILSGLCVVVFIYGAGRTLFGAAAHKGSWMPGVITMLFSGIAYVCITYAADIIAWFSNWITM